MNNFNWENKPNKVFVAAPPNSQVVFQYNDKVVNTFSIREALNTPGGNIIINWVNRKYISDLLKFKLKSIPFIEPHFTTNQKEEDTSIVGCLPVFLLDISTTDHNLFLDPRRLTNWFIHIVSRVIPVERILPPELVTQVNLTFYLRDTNICLPKHGLVNISDLISSALNTLEFENIMELGNEKGEKLNDELSISYIFKLLIPKLQSMFLATKINRKRNSSGRAKGGKIKMSHDFYKILDDNDVLTKIEKWSENSLGFITDKLRECHPFILKKVCDINNTNMWAVKKFIDIIVKNSDIDPIYFNEKITFPHMIHVIGEIFHILFIDILPNESMESAIHGTLYHMAYLQDLNLLDTFKKYLYIPILYRLIYSCYETNSPFIEPAIAYLSENHYTVYRGLLNFQKQIPIWQRNMNNNTDLSAWLESNCDGSIDRFCFIAAQSEKHLNNEKFMDALYWAIYAIRGQVLDYYIIFILIIYRNSLALQNIRAGNMISKPNKNLNCKNMASPFFRIFICFYDYIKSIPPHLITVDILNNAEFGELPQYRHIIINALKDFLKENEDVFSSLLKD
ncbi:hypothetical protein TCON_2071 [Astathelohania contejeani]|uniref:Uncharacterized protein n=1 Tax=Astathelohania contejeani TaxID=164912 RepID=A0ABQ7HX27_9MICR|nr:hypothetical protein TCON_2071 [Thelohania contejeani]